VLGRDAGVVGEGIADAALVGVGVDVIAVVGGERPEDARRGSVEVFVAVELDDLVGRHAEAFGEDFDRLNRLIGDVLPQVGAEQIGDATAARGCG
jgi:hypothetical protein